MFFEKFKFNDKLKINRFPHVPAMKRSSHHIGTHESQCHDGPGTADLGTDPNSLLATMG